jgi:hypothetical protein
MKIRLTVDVPVAMEHGLTKGRVLDVLIVDDGDGTRGRRGRRGTRGLWVTSDAGSVKVRPHEYEVVADDEPT